VENQQLAMFPLAWWSFLTKSWACASSNRATRQMLHDIAPENQFGTCLIERGSEVGGNDERTSVGTIVQILGAHHLIDGKTLVMVEESVVWRSLRGSRTIPTRGLSRVSDAVTKWRSNRRCSSPPSQRCAALRKSPERGLCRPMSPGQL